MATIWHPDICDCEMQLGADGEPVAFIKQCDRHKDSKPADVATECRAKEIAREAIRQALERDQPPDWQRGKDGGHEIILPDTLDAKARADLEAAVAGSIDVRFTKLTTVAEIAAETAEIAGAEKKVG